MLSEGEDCFAYNVAALYVDIVVQVYHRTDGKHFGKKVQGNVTINRDVVDSKST